ncbi:MULTISPECIES: hypothetical protein [unclassified Rhizobium]|uniref:hypothetical protein n=1 Tax=unclassified Rhizobium TaxID=2613769 RepID=UPI00216A11D2|nr:MULTISPECIES: hypothetical protein [unclassified Rhizobium]MCS3742086.1 hypothetical protein [Rhizobium sp. BK661]MCS4093996.1 hypothetical protein [Rhizobium sp. BK176]
MLTRFEIQASRDGTNRWAIVDRTTGLVAVVGDVRINSLDWEEADDLVDLLNLLYLEQKSAIVHQPKAGPHTDSVPEVVCECDTR